MIWTANIVLVLYYRYIQFSRRYRRCLPERSSVGRLDDGRRIAVMRPGASGSGTTRIDERCGRGRNRSWHYSGRGLEDAGMLDDKAQCRRKEVTGRAVGAGGGNGRQRLCDGTKSQTCTQNFSPVNKLTRRIVASSSSPLSVQSSSS